jgi:uncharacterized membrane protein (DUF4010 family)
METDISLAGLAAAIGLGLLIGVVRERADPDPTHTIAGVRTHVLVALSGALGAALGTPVLMVVLVLVGALAVASYVKAGNRDLGLTGEVALPTTALLAALALSHPALAAGISVVVAAVLYAKRPLHDLARQGISEQELQDVLLLAGAALVVLPLLPDQPIDPWGVLIPARLWRLVVLILAVGMIGHIALRLVGARWGLPLAGFLSGFASSTAAVAGFGHRSRQQPEFVSYAASGALFANLGSLVLFGGVVAAAAPTLWQAAMGPLAAAGAALVLVASLGLLRPGKIDGLPQDNAPQALKLSHAMLLAGLMALLLLASAWLQRHFGPAAVLAATSAVALVEVHAAAASIAQLVGNGSLDLDPATAGLVLLLAVSALAKGLVAFLAGGRAYGSRVALGLLVVPVAAGLWLLVRNGPVPLP